MVTPSRLQPCLYHFRDNNCTNKRCPYGHDPELFRGKPCSWGDKCAIGVYKCPLVHGDTKRHNPCRYQFTKGACERHECPFGHEAEAFMYRYCPFKENCELGDKCPMVHVSYPSVSSDLLPCLNHFRGRACKRDACPNSHDREELKDKACVLRGCPLQGSCPMRHGHGRAAKPAEASKTLAPCLYHFRDNNCTNKSCPHGHDPELFRGKPCSWGDKCAIGVYKCPLSHSSQAAAKTKTVVPHHDQPCLHFYSGACTNTRCDYSHDSAVLSTKVCYPYITGSCRLNMKCPMRHMCPDYMKRTCPNKDGRCPSGQHCAEERRRYPCEKFLFGICKFPPATCRRSHDKEDLRAKRPDAVVFSGLGRLTDAYLNFFVQSNALLLALFKAAVIAAAANPSRADLMLKPRPAAGDLPDDAEAQRAVADNAALQRLAEALPTLESMAAKVAQLVSQSAGSQYAASVSIEDFVNSARRSVLMSRHNPSARGLSALFSWVVSSNTSYLVQLTEANRMPELGTAHQYLMLVSDIKAEAEFAQLRKQRGSVFAFHGSAGCNWHSIMRNGLAVMSGTTGQVNGSVHGAGVYVAPAMSTSLRSYSKAQFDASQHVVSGAFDPETMTCLALCEVIEGTYKVHKDGWCWTIADRAHIKVRFVFVYPRGTYGRAAQTSTKSTDQSFVENVRRIHRQSLIDNDLE